MVRINKSTKNPEVAKTEVQKEKVQKEKVQKEKVEKKKHARRVNECNGLPNFNPYIRNVLGGLFAKMGMTSKTRAEVQYLVHNLVTRISNTARVILSKQTLSVTDINAAVRLVLPAGLASEAVARGNKALESYLTTPKSRDTTREKRAGVIFRIPRCSRALRHLDNYKRISDKTPVYLAAVLEHVTSRVLRQAGEQATSNKKSRIKPRHLLLAIHGDNDLRALYHNVILSGGVVPVA